MRYFLSVIVLICFFSGAYAQKYPFKTYTIKDGLAQSQVSSIAQDRFGFLWIGTQSGGVSRFDGQYFRNFNKKDGLISNVVNTLHFSKREDKLWIGTANGLMYYDGQAFHQLPFPVANEFDGEIQQLMEDHLGRIWFTTMHGGVRCYGQGKIRHYQTKKELPEGRVSDMLQMDNSRIFFSTFQSGIYEFKDSTFVRLDMPLEKERIMQIGQYSPDEMLIATPDVVYTYDFRSQTLSVLLDLAPFKTRGVWDIEKDQNGTFWFATSRGVISYSEKGVGTHFDETNGYFPDMVMDVFIDSQNNAWIGSEINGLSKFLGTHFTSFDQTERGPIGAIMGILEDHEGKILVSTYGKGFFELQGDRFVNRTLKGEDPVIYGIERQGTTVWVAAQTQLIAIDGKHRKYFSINDGLPNSSVNNLEVDHQNRLWVSTIKGIATFNGKSFDAFPHFKTEEHGVPRGLYRDGNAMIIYTTNAFFLWDGNSLRPYSNLSVFEDTRILGVCALGNKEYLVATLGEGIIKIDFNNTEWLRIDQSDGLISDVVYQIFKDEKGTFYAGTEKGISLIRFLGDDISIRNLDSESGFLALETNQNAVSINKNGDIYLGTVAGLYKFSPNQLRPKTSSLRANLIWVGPYYEVDKWEAEYQKKYGWFGLPDGLTIPYHQNHLSFKFSAIDLSLPKGVYYRIKLQGFDQDWMEPITYGKAAYSNLPTGEYTLMVQSSGSPDTWGRDYLSYSFVVLPPFWQTWWFYSIAILVLGLSIKFIQDRRIQIQVERAVLIEKVKADEHEKIRKSVARDFHDELGNHLASIIVMVQMIRHKLVGKAPDTVPLVDQMEDSAKTLFNGTRDFIWSIDPENDTMDAVYCNIKDFGEELFDHTPFNFYTETTPSQIPALRLPANWSRHITLLFKEAMTNSLKYAEGTEVRLVWRFNEPFLLTVIFQDNGKGFEYDPEKSKRGLANMRHRAQKLGGKLHISSIIGQGCKVQLELKIPTIG